MSVPQRSDYLAPLLAALPADVRRRLDEVGEVAIDDANLAAMRGRTLRSPGTPTGAVAHTDHHVPGAPGDPDVAVRLHRERDVTLPRPGLISIHGGGYVIGSHLGDDGRFDGWCTTLQCVGVSVGYRLAPETPYPGAYQSNDDDVPAYAVPARARDLTGLPPAFVTVGNLDGLLDEDLDYARRLIAAGVPTDVHVFADGPHAFDSMLPNTAIAARARRTLEDWLQARMHPETEAA